MELTSQERFARMFEHRDADRVPIIDEPWFSTVARWENEGMPKGMDFRDYFGMDKWTTFSVDNSPRYEEKLIEETDDYRIYTTKFGVTAKDWKKANSTPEYLDFTIVDPDSWAKAKERITYSDDRIDWKWYERNYKKMREEGWWIQAGLYFGFDVTHSWIVGTENLLIAMLEEPEWCMDMFETELDIQLKLYDRLWDAGYTFDSIFWPDDMGYKHSQFFSMNVYREVLKPFHKKAIDWAHAKGIKAHMHSCGDVNPFVPELIGMGLDALNPLEVKAGMDPEYLKKTYGGKLVFHGGFNALLYNDMEAMREEVKRLLPIMKENGGYIFSTDHSVPSTVSLEDFREFVNLAKEYGKY